MVLGFGLIVFALLAIYSGLKGKTIAETIRGDLGGGFILSSVSGPEIELKPASHIASGGSGDPITSAAAFAGTISTSGGAKSIVDGAAQIGSGFGLKVVSSHRPGDTDSDHGRNDAISAARDLSNGSAPTREMDATAEAIAKALGTRVNGKREIVKSWNYKGYRIQLLYRTNTGGNHFNHVHIGARKA